MNRFFPRALPFALVFGLGATFVAGCSQKEAQQPAPGNGAGKQGAVTPPEQKEDPEVAAYFKKKGWTLGRDMRISDGKWTTFLSIADSAKPFEKVTLTEDDYKMIA